MSNELEARRQATITALDGIWEERHIPRVHVRLPVPGLPENVAKVWEGSPTGIYIDLDPKYPLELSYTNDGIEVSLAFKGVVARCTLPWTQILAIVKMVGGVPGGAYFPPIDVNVNSRKEAVAAGLTKDVEAQPAPAMARPALRLIRGGKG